MSRIININDVKLSINDYLTQEPWRNNHYSFYKMLLQLAKKYSDKAVTYNQSNNDNKDIILNVKEQQWFKYSVNKTYILQLLNNMYITDITDIKDIKDIKDIPSYVLKLNMGNNVWFLIEYLNKNSNSKKQIKYRVSFMNHMDSHAYICYYNSLKSKSRKLPEYDKINEYLPELTRFEIICIVNELIIYYDIYKLFTDIHIGSDYPLSLHKLTEVTFSKLKK